MSIKLWEERLQHGALVLGRLLVACLFFTQLWWKVPPSFGCPADYAFTTAAADGSLHRTSGLCDWIGIESIGAKGPRPILVADMRSAGGPLLSIDISFLDRLNGAFIDSFVMPNIRWFGFAVWGMEAFIFVSLFFGVFSRVGALVALAQSMQLWMGLAGLGLAGEWEWSYNWMPVVAFILLTMGAGRWLGIDQLLLPRLQAAAGKGNRIAAVLVWLM
jgi:hypothetical protein